MTKVKDNGNIAKTIESLTGQKPEVREENDFNYGLQVVEKLYNLIQPYQQTVEPNNLVKFSSSEEVGDDAYWLQLIDLYNNASSTFSNLIDLRRNMLVGSGLIPTVEETDALYAPTIEFLNRENEFGESLQADIWQKICFDYSLMETYFLECIYSQEKKVVSINHWTPTKCRAVAPDNPDLNYVNVWQLSNSFGRTNKAGKKNPVATSGKPVANWQPKNWAIDGGRQILNCMRYSAGNNFYAVPSHNAILPYAELQAQLAIFSLSTVSKGFAPQNLVILNGNPDKKAKDEFVRHFKQRYTGANGERTLFIWTTGAEKPEILPFNSTDITPMIESLQRISVESIASGMGASIELVGTSAGASLQTDMNKLATAYNFYQISRIKPMLAEILKTLNKIFRLNGLSDVKVVVEPLKIDTAPSQAPVVIQPNNQTKI